MGRVLARDSAAVAPGGDLLDDAHRPRRIQRPVGQYGLQIATLDQPHIHVETVVDFAIVVNRDHVRAVQPCRGVGLARNRC